MADDALIIQQVVDDLAANGGGTIYFPNGAYRCATKIVISSPSINLVGTGMRKVYPASYVPDPDGIAVLFSDHTGRALIEFFSDSLNAIGAITFQDISFSTTARMHVCRACSVGSVVTSSMTSTLSAVLSLVWSLSLTCTHQRVI